MPLTLSPYNSNLISLTLKVKGAAGTAVEYRCQLGSAVLTPTGGGGGGGTSYETFCNSFPAPATSQGYTLDLGGFAQFTDATDLARFLFTNAGSTLAFVLTPMGGTPSATNPAFSGECLAVPTAIGSASANAYATLTVSLPVTLAPTMVVA